jgi:hypothetical protein
MRRYDIDSLRVIAFGLLIFYHTGMFFVPWEFHLKNPVTYEWLIYPMRFLNQWRLPLLFVISGMGTYFALTRRSGFQYAGERMKRLLIPLIAGMIFLIPPQVYFERLDKRQFSGSYFFDYWPGVAFNGVYPEGNISWHHLWFILYLFIFSTVMIPVFLYLRKCPEAWIIRKIKSASRKYAGLYIFIIPLFLWQIFLAPRYPQTYGLINDWYNLINYCTFFLFGYLLVSLKDTFWTSVTQNRRKYLAGGIVAFPLLMLWYAAGDFPGKEHVSALGKVFNIWSWILALIGYSAAYLNKPGRTLSYANEAVYPFFILHQTVLMGLCYYLKNADLGFFTKFSVLSIGTFGISWIVYEFGIRRYPLTRLLFGMKSKVNGHRNGREAKPGG